MDGWRQVKAGVAVVTLAAGMLAPMGAWAAQSAETMSLIAAHRQAAVEAQQKIIYHEEMAQKVGQHPHGKFDVQAH